MATLHLVKWLCSSKASQGFSRLFPNPKAQSVQGYCRSIQIETGRKRLTWPAARHDICSTYSNIQIGDAAAMAPTVARSFWEPKCRKFFCCCITKHSVAASSVASFYGRCNDGPEDLFHPPSNVLWGMAASNVSGI